MDDMANYLDELNEDQRSAVEYAGSPLLIMAGAGSGKTKTLTYKAAHLIDSGTITPEQLLMVTFTNKAAGEMRETLQNHRSQDPQCGDFSLNVGENLAP